MKRESGILMHISSLPSDYGIGTMGAAARSFVDFLQKSKQAYWQILPFGPTGNADSPYQSFSVFAGNPYFIDLDELLASGLLDQQEIDAHELPRDVAPVDYGRLYETRLPILRNAFHRGFNAEDGTYQNFLSENGDWIYDYSFFMALKEHFNFIPLAEWPRDIRTRRPEAMHSYGVALEESINFHRYLQFLFFGQYGALKRYANEHGIKIFGDIPIYPSADSADVWSWPQNYQIDSDYHLEAVAGVPPDYFSADGQLWGNPLYDWDRHAEDGYSWWTLRFAHLNGLLDAVRIDHFRAFHSYFSIPYGETTARGGSWRIGPEMALIDHIKRRFPDLLIIAEDLGDLDESAVDFVRRSGIPGMKVLQFAFDGPNSQYLPHNIERHCVVYTGTHDNNTLAGWLENDTNAVRYAKKYFNIGADESVENASRKIVRAGMATTGDIFIAPIQDYLQQGGDDRMNTPSVSDGNWVYRARAELLTDELAAEIADLTTLYGRAESKWPLIDNWVDPDIPPEQLEKAEPIKRAEEADDSAQQR